MSWVKIDDGYFAHPKILQAGADAVVVELAAIAYCSRYRTDGVIERDEVRSSVAPLFNHRALTRRSDAACVKLVASGRWHVNGHDCPRCVQPPDGSYVIHDYLAYQPSAEKAQATSGVRSEAGRRGGVASGQARANKGEAKSKQNASEDGHVSEAGCFEANEPRPVPSRPVDLSSSSVSTASTGSPADDEEFWILVAEVALKQRQNSLSLEPVANPDAWKRKTAAQKRGKHEDEARKWFEVYDVDRLQLATAIATGDVPASWHTQRRTA